MASNNGEQRPQNVVADFIAKLKQLPKWLLVAFTFVTLACAAVHDSLCQHLTGTALAEQFLVEKLAARGAPEVADANRVVSLIEDAVSLARGLAAGLFPLEADGGDLPTALRSWPYIYRADSM